ncbi:response regulator [Paraburkholderia bannensis]|uniref:response regulator n=1 Tax=Paraburkholderia bannensis TaxID=765414 RepID=UPI002AB7CC9B|nr:response regulator [Paraburkholderia bannensis]
MTAHLNRGLAWANRVRSQNLDGAYNMAGSRNILVLDSDPAMFGLVSLWLQDSGYRVMDRQWLGSVEGHHANAPGAIVVDLNCPETQARDEIASLNRAFPGTPVVATSGYFLVGPGMEAETARQFGVARVLAKPFHGAALVAVIDDLLQYRHRIAPT